MSSNPCFFSSRYSRLDDGEAGNDSDKSYKYSGSDLSTDDGSDGDTENSISTPNSDSESYLDPDERRHRRERKRLAKRERKKREREARRMGDWHTKPDAISEILSKFGQLHSGSNYLH